MNDEQQPHVPGEETAISTASLLVQALLDGDYDAHVKAYDRVQKWDKASSTYQEIAKQKLQAADLFTELGLSISYERALAHAGLTRADVARPIYGSQISRTHNYKKTRTVRRCANLYCQDRKPKPESQETCLTCGEPLVTGQMPYSFRDLHDKMPRHMMGVETNDGRRVWFDEPLPPRGSSLRPT